jgi:hypothetical protein
MFTRNEGIIDRTLRVALAMVLLSVGLFLLGGLQGNVPGLFVAGVGLLPLITGLTDFCPLYVPFGISTLEKEKEHVTSQSGTLVIRKAQLLKVRHWRKE